MVRCLFLTALTALLIAIVFSSCGAGLSKVDDTAPELHTTIDPFDFSDEFVSIPIQTQNEKTIVQEKPLNEVRDDVPDISSAGAVNQQDVETVHTPSVSTVTMRGYRVQVGAYEVKKNAEEMKEYVSVNFNLPVYLEYQPPFYRVRMGNFTDLHEAETYVEILRGKGFQDARWVPTTINVPQ